MNGFRAISTPPINDAMLEKKNVRFEGRVKIHEFEKYLDEIDDYGQEQDDDGSDGEDRSQNKDSQDSKNVLLRKSSIPM